MKPEKLIEVLSVAERLKDAVRHCYTFSLNIII